jgi:hypothetical protein
MSLVYDEPSTGVVAEVAKGAEIRRIGVHAEVGLGDDPSTPPSRLRECPSYSVEVEVRNNPNVRPREASAVDNRCVVEGVAYEQISSAGESTNNAEIC